MRRKKTSDTPLSLDFGKWTDYASSIEEFQKTFKYVGFNNFSAEAGGQGDTVKKDFF